MVNINFNKCAIAAQIFKRCLYMITLQNKSKQYISTEMHSIKKNKYDVLPVALAKPIRITHSSILR